MQNKLEYSTPEKEGIDSGWILKFLKQAKEHEKEIHGIIILVHNKVIFEAYNAPYCAEIPHIMHSFTKCLTNTAVGLAYTQGLLKLDDLVLDFFPEFKEKASKFLKRATIRNLITMRSGQERGIGGNEWRPLKSSWLNAYFEVPFIREPGSEYLYSSGNSYVLSAIVQKVTGKTCKDYLKEHITEKLGMRDFEWMLSPEGICSGGNGISLTVGDMARIGLLYLNRGKWNGEQLISEEWVDLALGYKERIIPEPGGVEYNFHWMHIGDMWASRGMFGQTCALVPDLDMVVAFTAADADYALNTMFQREVIDQAKAGCKVTEAHAPELEHWVQNMSLEGKRVSVVGHRIPEQKVYRFAVNGVVDQIKEIELVFDQQTVLYAVTDHRGRHEVKAGFEHWIRGETSMTGAYLHHQYEKDIIKISACAYWSEKDTLMMEWRYPEMAFFDHVSVKWEGEMVKINRWVNMNSQDLSRPEIAVAL